MHSFGGQEFRRSAGKIQLGVSLADEVRWGLEELGADGIALSLPVAQGVSMRFACWSFLTAQTAYRVAEGLKIECSIK